MHLSRLRYGEKNILYLPGLSAPAVMIHAGKSFVCFLPVYYPEPVVNICGAQIIVLQIICVFPYVNIQDECVGMAYRCVLIRRSHNLEHSAVRYKPCIA